MKSLWEKANWRILADNIRNNELRCCIFDCFTSLELFTIKLRYGEGPNWQTWAQGKKLQVKESHTFPQMLRHSGDLRLRLFLHSCRSSFSASHEKTKSFLTSKDFRRCDVISADWRRIHFQFLSHFLTSVYSESTKVPQKPRHTIGEQMWRSLIHHNSNSPSTHTQPKLPLLIVLSISSSGRRRPAEASQPVTGLPTWRNV